MTDCINLEQLYGVQYKVQCEDGSLCRDPWRLVMLCKYGHISPYGGQYVMACTDGQGRGLVTRLLAVPSAELIQDGTDGANVRFHIQEFDAVAGLMKARKRRTVNPVWLRSYQYKTDRTHVPYLDPERDGGDLSDSQAA
jgi:hypothetical protein